MPAFVTFATTFSCPVSSVHYTILASEDWR